jgi:hypothetical protein
MKEVLVATYRAEPGFHPLPAVKSPSFDHSTLYWPAFWFV